MDAVAVDAGGDGPADQGAGDVIQEARQHEDDDQQGEAAEPAVGENAGQHLGNPTVLEMPRQQREPEQQSEQVDQQDPLVAQVGRQTGEPRPLVKAGVLQLEGSDGGEPTERDDQGVMVEHGHPEQGGPEQQELHRDTNLDRGRFEGRRGGQAEPTRGEQPQGQEAQSNIAGAVGRLAGTVPAHGCEAFHGAATWGQGKGGA